MLPGESHRESGVGALRIQHSRRKLMRSLADARVQTESLWMLAGHESQAMDGQGSCRTSRWFFWGWGGFTKFFDFDISSTQPLGCFPTQLCKPKLRLSTHKREIWLDESSRQASSAQFRMRSLLGNYRVELLSAQLSPWDQKRKHPPCVDVT